MMAIILPKVYCLRKWADDMQEGLEIALLGRQTVEPMATGRIGEEENSLTKTPHHICTWSELPTLALCSYCIT